MGTGKKGILIFADIVRSMLPIKISKINLEGSDKLLR
jgi:hypothetical protein|tara:strand:+ start:151 stop:261 length:111 start_codon:yes stop_codon:yes gene_type:complete